MWCWARRSTIYFSRRRVIWRGRTTEYRGWRASRCSEFENIRSCCLCYSRGGQFSSYQSSLWRALINIVFWYNLRHMVLLRMAHNARFSGHPVLVGAKLADPFIINFIILFWVMLVWANVMSIFAIYALRIELHYASNLIASSYRELLQLSNDEPH